MASGEIELSPEQLEVVARPIEGAPAGKNLLSMHQLSASDIHMYLDEADAAEQTIDEHGGLNLLPFKVMKAIMRQPSTRTAGSMTTAMLKLGGAADLISGMESSAEAKGETLADSWVAYATQSDIIGTRTYEDYGPAFAAFSIAQAREKALPRIWLENVPVINLGDGKNEHPTQALGDFFAMRSFLDNLEGKTIAMVGDHARYRAFHSLIIGAAKLNMHVIAVESPVAQVPENIRTLLGDKLSKTADLDDAMADCDVLYVGRNPDEYSGDDSAERMRNLELQKAYESWHIDRKRLQQMDVNAKVFHPRPRYTEINPDVDSDRRMYDVHQMAAMIPVRMAIIALHMGKSIVQFRQQQRHDSRIS